MVMSQAVARALGSTLLLLIIFSIQSLPSQASNYTLTIKIPEENVTQLINDGYKIGLIQTKKGTETRLPVIWQSVTPAGNSTLTWADTFKVYNSSVEIAVGNKVSILSSNEASGGKTYCYTSDGLFKQCGSGLENDQYGIENQDQSKAWTLGLAMSTTYNSQNPEFLPINAETVLYKTTAMFQPTQDTITVFVGSGFETGSLVPDNIFAKNEVFLIVTSDPLVLDFSTVTTKTICYDGNDNGFSSDCPE